MRTRKSEESRGVARRLRRITVFSSPRERHRGFLRCGTLVLPCALGRTGVTHLKREGDGGTPAGRYRLLSLYYRPDRVLAPTQKIPARAMRPDDGWCEDPAHGRYNCPIRLPSCAGHEAMWRKDNLYDIVGALDWNMRPRIRGRGSAIFLHLCRPGFAPTAGCIALRMRDLRLLLTATGGRPEFLVAAKPRKAAAVRRELLRAPTRCIFSRHRRV